MNSNIKVDFALPDIQARLILTGFAFRLLHQGVLYWTVPLNSKWIEFLEAELVREQCRIVFDHPDQIKGLVSLHPRVDTFLGFNKRTVDLIVEDCSGLGNYFLKNKGPWKIRMCTNMVLSAILNLLPGPILLVPSTESTDDIFQNEMLQAGLSIPEPIIHESELDQDLIPIARIAINGDLIFVEN